MTAHSRALRGRETERILAEDLRLSGAPDARENAASARGRDILGVAGIAIECKARARFRPLEWIRQAVKNAKGDYPIVVLRCDGQGAAQVDDWPTIMRWADLKELLREAGYLAGDRHQVRV